MSLAKAVHPQAQAENTWTSIQAYVLAVFCLVLGVALGYLFRGSASPDGGPTSSASAALPVGAGGQQLSQEQQKAMIDKAAAPLLEALKTNPTDAETLAKVANVYYDGQQFGEAIQYYDRALKINPNDADVRTDLGTAYWYTGEADKAIAEYQKSLKLRPGHSGTLFNLGIVRWQGKMDPKGAVEAWEELLKLNPDYAQKQQVIDYIQKAKQHAARDSKS